ncbi:MAG: hypothetical protein JOZ78_07840 [Chroococcidiopsidaceae cyanobacterium CP_BM_ER_R8_30]|nr:hypothetical protein [Chroococcidiopsidaceae cyanobacterium CP_BM_ER_R8_30]
MDRFLRPAFWILILCLICLPGILFFNQFIQLSNTPTPEFIQPNSIEQLTWATQIGKRITKLRVQIPTVDRVVLVPDAATFLSAIEQWSLQGRWPILIEDEYYTPIFLRRFHPAQVIRLSTVAQPLPEGQTLRQQMLRATAKAWNSEPGELLKKVWQRLGWRPPGVVVTWESDSAWPAAVSLAADRGQPLVFLEGDFGSPNSSLSPAQWQSLQDNVQQVVEKTGYTYAELGDDIDTITIARQMAVKYQPSETAGDRLAITDGLARHPDGQRWAVVGWIYGSSVRALYQAMCSIFLTQKTALLYDTYPRSDVWGLYAMNEAARQLSDIDLDVQLIQRPQAGVSNWRQLTANGLNFDLIFVNSKGSSTSFNLGDGNASVQDVPTLNTPAAVHFIHSWSATAPDDRNTVGGRWLEHGTYAYVGSVNEPYLQAFVTPQLLAEHLRRLTPFLIAARQVADQPWKITTIGDPLMTLVEERTRVASEYEYDKIPSPAPTQRSAGATSGSCDELAQFFSSVSLPPMSPPDCQRILSGLC